MSTMTLNLPMNYVDVDREEMEYVDGGFSMQVTKSYGIPIAASLNFSNSDLWAISVAGAGAGGLLAIWCPEPLISKIVASALIAASVAVGVAASYGKQLSVVWIAGVGIAQFKFY
ncbi:MAG: hypothetical protein AB6733_20605 [Clostridiaceae bacterium]